MKSAGSAQMMMKMIMMMMVIMKIAMMVMMMMITMVVMMMMMMMMMRLTGEIEIMEAISSDRMPWARSQPCNGGHADDDDHYDRDDHDAIGKNGEIQLIRLEKCI